MILGRLLPTLLLCLNFSVGLAQNWRLLNAGREAYFGFPSDGTVRECLRIDSFTVDGTDTTFYPYRFIVPPEVRSADTCKPVTQGYCAFGQWIKVKPYGAWIFYGRDSVHHMGGDYTFHTQPSSQWVVHENPALGTSVLAISYAYSVGTVLGQVDSLLTIHLRKYDSMGDYDTTSVVFSRDHGIVRWPALLPDYRFGSLVGLSQPALGIQDQPKERFFSMQPGDTIQIQHYRNDGTIIRNSYIEDVYQQRVLSQGGDTLFFEINTRTASTTNNWATGTITPSVSRWDTIPLNDPFYLRLDRKFGEEWQPDANLSSWVREWRTRIGRLQKPSNLTDTLDVSDHCMISSPLGPPNCRYDNYYGDGLGGPYFICQSYWPQPYYYEFRQPVYARLSNQVLGNPRNLNALVSAQPTQEIEDFRIDLYPNPAEQELNVSLAEHQVKGRLEIELIDMQGVVVQRLALLVAKSFTLDIAALPAGIYALKLTSMHGTVSKLFTKR